MNKISYVYMAIDNDKFYSQPFVAEFRRRQPDGEIVTRKYKREKTPDYVTEMIHDHTHNKKSDISVIAKQNRVAFFIYPKPS